MKRGTLGHPKLKRIARRLELEPWATLGLLEALLHWAYVYARRGDVGRFADQDIADGIGWRGDAGELVAVLANEHWLDLCAENRLVIHDLADHADDTWRKALSRAGEKFAVAVPPVNGLMPDIDRTMTGQTPDIVPTPSAEKRTCQARPGQAGERHGADPPTLGSSSGTVSNHSARAPNGKRGWRRVPPGEEFTEARMAMGRDASGLLGSEVRRAWGAFVDHEFARPRRDVDATWRNWCRKEKPRRAAPPAAPTDRPEAAPTAKPREFVLGAGDGAYKVFRAGGA